MGAPRIVPVIDGHDWREKVIYHGAPGYRIERVPGQLVCIDCGMEKALGAKPARSCAEQWSAATGYPAVSNLPEITNDHQTALPWMRKRR